MAWSTVVSMDRQFCDVAYATEYKEAEDERNEDTRGNAGTVISSGDGFGNLQRIQTSLTTDITSWLNTAISPSDYTTLTSTTAFSDYNFTTASFFTLVNGGTGWRRYTTHPDDGGSLLYGPIQAGDVIGDWLYEDIQAGFNLKVKRTQWGIWDTLNGGHTYGLGEFEADAATAKSAATTDFNAQPTGIAWTPESSTYLDVFDGGTAPDTYTASMTRGASDMKIELGFEYNYKCEMKFHFIPLAVSGGTFHLQDATGLVENYWHLLDTQTILANDGNIYQYGSQIVNNTLLTTALTNWPSTPAPGLDDSLGWIASTSSIWATIDYSITGGFSYV